MQSDDCQLENNTPIDEPVASPWDLTLIALARTNNASPRLRNALQIVSDSGLLPFRTVRQYLEHDKKKAVVLLHRVPKFGKKNATELLGLLQDYQLEISSEEGHDTKTASRKIETRQLVKKPIDSELRNLSLLELVIKSGGTVRLTNVLREVHRASDGIYKTVGEYLEGGKKAEHWFSKLPAVGLKTALELREIVSRFARDQMGETDQPGDFVCDRGGKAVEYPWLLTNLTPRELLVISERYGLDKRAPRTLEELGKQLGVTRERIRQLESKAIAALRARFSEEITSYLRSHEQKIWSAVTDNSGFLRKQDEADARRRLLPVEALAIDIIHGSLAGWLAQHAQPCGEGWIPKDAVASTIESVRAKILSIVGEGEIPIPIEKIAHRFAVSKESFQITLRMGGGFSEYLGYIVKTPLGRRGRRAVRLHRIMCAEYPEASISLWSLRKTYVEAFLDDQCSIRDMQIVMADAPHLFLNMYEEGWMALNKYPCVSFVPLHECTGLEPDVPEDIYSPREEVTIAGTLRGILHSNGPMSFDELRQRFVVIAGARYSKSSVGPVLITNTDRFVRFSPGIYGLREHLEQPQTMAKTMEALLGVKHLAIYCRARWAGEPSGMYPMWNVEMERCWARWCRDTKQEDLLHSLLAIAELGAWNVSNLERERWERLSTRHAVYLLEEENNTSIIETTPRLVEVVACSLQAKQRAGISWISANRVCGLRIDDQHSNTILALLIALGVVEAAEHWQRWHPFNPQASNTIEQLVAVLESNPESAWPEGALEILAEAGAIEREWGWLDPNEVTLLLDTLSATGESQSLSTKKLDGNLGDDFDLDSLIKLSLKNRAQRNGGLLH